MSEARVVRPDRNQLSWEMIDLDALLALDHRARIVWQFVESLDLRPLYDAIGSRAFSAGRPSADPAVLLALWLYATVEGVGSARALGRLVERDIAYRWLAGGVPVNYHGLADFRVGHEAVLDRLLSESVTALIAEGLVDLDEIALDGTKIRASARRGSYGGPDRLRRIETAVGARLAALKEELTGDPEASSRRKRAARERAAQEILARAGRARAALERLQREKARRAKTHAKEEAEKKDETVSISDPEARRMRFADGSVHAGYNMQVAAHPASTIVVSIEATDRRNDSALAVPMVDDIARRYGRTPKRLLVDTLYATQSDIVQLAGHPVGPVMVYAPLPKEHTAADLKPASLKRRAYERAREPRAIAQWRSRMTAPQSDIVYSRRKRIELVNAQMKNRGFGRITVRGLLKAKAVALWHALAHNLLAAHRLRTALA
jgi:transposase/nucleoid-associated protein YgaU